MQTNNKLREAVALALSLLDLKEGVPYKTVSRKDIDFMKAALAAPPRNCDVGTAEEQEKRYIKLKREHIDKLERCPAVGYSFFFPDSLYWAQMPYEEGGAK